ncbi:MAG: aspartyl/asparaginyl beta-hydroxylase domain-containing protein [Methylococcales bacterium]|nr:aspartyl/asparaginyl beta-hydroxylase domain-containing protein [Methylococcales bacterium]
MTSLARTLVKRYGRKLRKTMNHFVARYSLIGDPEVFNAEQFAWTGQLEAHWETIRDEALALLQARSEIPHLGDISPDHQRLDYQRTWRTFFLRGYGYRVDDNCAKAPATAALVDQIPGVLSALFSVFEPNTHLPAHKGVTKGMITCHLPLVVPNQPEKCRIAVNDQSYHWTPGKFFIFDDTRQHEVWNETDQDRTFY